MGLDLGQRTGWAIGRPGEKPRSGAEVLKDPRDSREYAFAGFMRFLQTTWKAERPELVVAEAPLTLAAFLKLKSSEANVQMHFGLHAIVRGLCAMWNINFRECNNATCRKHFIGVGRMGERQATKDAVVARAKLLRLVPPDNEDEDRCDALCVQDWACATFGQRAAAVKELYLFGEKPR